MIIHKKTLITTKLKFLHFTDFLNCRNANSPIIRKYLSQIPFIIQLNTGDVIDRDETQSESSNFEGIRFLVASSEMLNVVPVLLSEDAVVER